MSVYLSTLAALALGFGCAAFPKKLLRFFFNKHYDRTGNEPGLLPIVCTVIFGLLSGAAGVYSVICLINGVALF